MGSSHEYNRSPAASANSATWWSLMENSDTSEDEPQHYLGDGRRRLLAKKGRPYESSTCPDLAPATVQSSSRRLDCDSSPSRQSSAQSRRSLGEQLTTRKPVSRCHSEKMPKRLTQRAPSPRFHSRLSSVTSTASPRASLDDEDSDKRIRWETPITHRYQLTDQPRLLEEKFLNVLDSVQANMGCSQTFDKPILRGSLWNLVEKSAGHGSSSSKTGDGTNECNSHAQSFDDESRDVSAFEGGPSFVEITGNPPVFSESITASESLLSTSRDSDEQDKNNVERTDVSHRRYVAASRSDRENATNPNQPADSSQILDDLSGMESERKAVEPNSGLKIGGEQAIVVKSGGRPSVRIYSTALPFDKGKKCIVGMGKLQDMHKARSGTVATRMTSDTNKKQQLVLRKKLQDSSRIPPIADIHVGDSNDISTLTASENSFPFQAKNKRNIYDRRTNEEGAIPFCGTAENEGPFAEPSNVKNLYNNSYHDTRSCIPLRLRRKRRGADGATASFSSKSVGLRLPSRSGDATNTTFERENDADSPYDYEYDSGVNTYVAYFEIGKPKESRPSLQVIEHPNPPLLPFGSNEVVVKIEASTISQSDCAIWRGEWWGGTLSLPRIPGVAFAGKIDQVHKSGRISMQRGDQVLSLVCSGANSRYVCIPRERLVKVPSNINLDAAQLACLPEIYLSAFQVLHFGQHNGTRHRKNSLSGKAVMFVGGASAFGQAVVELGVEAGASVVYATANKVKQFQRIIEMGGIPLSDNPTDWLQTINQQVDILIGCTSGALNDTDPLTYDHLNVLKKKGQLILLGGPGAASDYPVMLPGKTVCQVDVFKILKRAHKHNVFENWERDMRQGKRDLTHLVNLLNKGALKPKLLERISLSKVSKAEEIVEARRLHGVIVCEPWIKGKQQ